MVDRREQLAVSPTEPARPEDGEGHGGVRLVVSVVDLPEPSEIELEEARLRSARSGLEMVDLRQLDIDPSAAEALPTSIARRHRAAAIGRRFGLPLIAIAAPENLLAIDDIYLAAGTDVLLVVAPERQVEACVEALYPPPDRTRPSALAEPAEDSAPTVSEHHLELDTAEARYGTDDVDWYRIGAFVGEGVRSDPVLPPPAPFEEPPFVFPSGLLEEGTSLDEEAAEAALGDDQTDAVAVGDDEPATETEAAGDAGIAEETSDAAAVVAELVAPVEPAEGAEAAEASSDVDGADEDSPASLDPSAGELGLDHAEDVLDAALESATVAEVASGEPELPWWMQAAAAPAAPAPAAFDDGEDPSPGAPLFGPPAPTSLGLDAPASDVPAVEIPAFDPPVLEPPAFETLETPGFDVPAFGAPAEADRWGAQGPFGEAAVAPAAAPVEPAPKPTWRQHDVGDILLAKGLLAEDQLATARQNSRTTGRPLRAVLGELHLVEEGDVLRAVAEEAGRQLIDLDQWPIDARAGTLLPESVARRYRILAVGFEDGRPVVATADPSDVLALDDVRTLLGGDIVIVVCSAQQIEVYLGRVYRHTEETDLAARHAALVVSGPEKSQLADLEDLSSIADDAPVVKFVNLVLRQALNENASDVHIEPTAKDLAVRCRIDGVLHHLTSAPKAIQGSVTSRLKVMAGLDIAEHRIPQDGRFSLGAGNRQVDLRVATLPTVHGEKIVLRILDKSTAPLDLDRLGFLPGVLERYQLAYRKPAGTILVTGPTGSGKSTTLYATLAELNSPERNLITVEDPVEYQLGGVNQVQVNPKAGLTFASALRSILRSDPDIILVGEIRDKETATIAIEAALTGHLVLSCLHTNDAVSTPIRLIEMGVEPFLVGSAIDCILAQRLARILCQRCAQPYEPNSEELRAAGWDEAVLGGEEAPAFRRAQGCQACSGTGYRGRIAIQEVLLVDEEIERAILDRAPNDEMIRLARAQGMTSLRWDGLHKAALGITSLEEIMRVVV